MSHYQLASDTLELISLHYQEGWNCEKFFIPHYHTSLCWSESTTRSCTFVRRKRMEGWQWERFVVKRRNILHLCFHCINHFRLSVFRLILFHSLSPVFSVLILDHCLFIPVIQNPSLLIRIRTLYPLCLTLLQKLSDTWGPTVCLPGATMCPQHCDFRMIYFAASIITRIPHADPKNTCHSAKIPPILCED